MDETDVTIEDLRGYRKLKSMVEQTAQKISSLDALYDTYRSPSFERIGSNPSLSSDPTADAAHRIEDLRAKYTEEIADLTRRLDRIETWVHPIGDVEVQLIVSAHFINGHSWKETTKIVYGSANDRNAYRAFRRFMGKDN